MWDGDGSLVRFVRVLAEGETRVVPIVVRLIFIPVLQLGNLSDTSDGRIRLDAARSNIATEMMKIGRI